MIKVLVVEDDFRVASIHAAYVDKVPGYNVVGQARSAHDCVRSIKELRPDLVLLDLYLPDRNGLDVLKCVRQPGTLELDVDVIVVTAAQDVASVRAAMRLGALHYLLKPFGFPALKDKLVAYQAMRQDLHAISHVDQPSVDRLYGALSGPWANLAQHHPGHPTLDAVQNVLVTSDEDLSAADVGARLGFSRATAQRYLAQLEALGRVTMTPRYGAAGRPEHRYRLTAARSDPAG
ncbi:MAG: response regulator [Acidimicrobiales bacterium]